jgi:zinc-ribbon domain
LLIQTHAFSFRDLREECPNCGADLPAGALSCPECGSDENTGWSEEAKTDGLGLPDDSFDYDQFVKKEFGSEEQRPSGIRWLWWIVAVVLLLVFILIWLQW